MTDEKECFFISPIGDDGSDERERSDKVIEYILEEALTEYDYTVTRADHMDEPGSITNQVIQKTTDSDLVIADLTGHNPNVFYELAVRHATGEPYIQIIDSEESIPFDINDFRSVKYGLDVEEADRAREQIAEQVSKVEDDGQGFNNPISESASVESLLTSDNPEEQQLGKLVESVSRIDRRLKRIEDQQTGETANSRSRFENMDEKETRINGVTYTIDQPVAPGAIESIADREEIDPKELRQKLLGEGFTINTN